MRRLIWVPTGRRLWLDAALALQAARVAAPVIWIGDDTHLTAARTAFPQARVIPLRPMVRGARSVPPGPPGDGAFWTWDGAALARDHALKLMDREDHSGTFTLLEREAHLQELVLWAEGVITEAAPDALVMAEAPHAVATYVLAAVARSRGIPEFSFSSWPLLPGIQLCTGPDQARLPAPGGLPGRADFLKRGLAEVDAYVARFDGDTYAFEPRYMKRQTYRATGTGRLRDVPVLRRLAHALNLLKPKKLRAALARGHLARALQTVPLPQGRLVYFPLHYEPERTTTPDGGAFYDQFRTLLRLRQMVPADCRIVVKEHPSVFAPSMNGHLGRHPRHYAALARIRGVDVVPVTLPSAQILRACEAVATISGTVALEAACMGKPALVFGRAWFQGCPNTTRWHDGFDWQAFLAAPCAGRPAIRDWLAAELAATVLPGTINPSNQKYFAAWYADPGFAEAETAAVTAALTEALAP